MKRFVIEFKTEVEVNDHETRSDVQQKLLVYLRNSVKNANIDSFKIIQTS